MIRKYGAGEVLGSPHTEGDEQGISKAAQRETADQPWTEGDAAELEQESRED